MAGINISKLAKKGGSVTTNRRRSTHSLSTLSDAYRNPSRSEIDLSNLEPKKEVCGLQETSKASLEREQSVSKASLEREQSVSKASLEREQKYPESDFLIKSVSKASLEREVEREQVREQSVSKASLEREQKVDISELSKQEDFLLSYLFETCSSLGQRTSPKIANYDLVELLKTTSGTLRNLLLRLKKKKILAVLKSKNGPSGWRIYELPEATYKQLSNKRNLKRASLEREQSVSRASPNASLRASLDLSSSSSSINTTTTSFEAYDAISSIHIPANLKNLGFSQSHIKQLKEKFTLIESQIQHGLESFSYDLEKGELDRLKARGVQNIIGYFFGAMKAGGYNSVTDGFITAEELAEKEMIERLEVRKKESSERNEKLINLLFEEWLETKTREELSNIENPIYQFLDKFHKANLKNYFQQNEMEKFKKEIDNANSLN
jgi:hypothetical protein